MVYYKNELEQVCQEIDDARADVVAAHRSGKVSAIVKADRKLADLHAQAREVLGGNVCDDR